MGLSQRSRSEAAPCEPPGPVDPLTALPPSPFFMSVMPCACAAAAAAAHAQGITDMKKGEGGSAVKGSTGPGGSQGAASDLERCDKPMGTVAVVEPQDY